MEQQTFEQSAEPAVVEPQGRPARRMVVPLALVALVAVAFLGALAFAVVFDEKYDMAASQRDRAQRELVAVQASVQAVAQREAAASCRFTRYVERSGVERVFVWDNGRSVPMPDRDLAWVQVEYLGNVWALLRDGASGERMTDRAGQPGEWVTFEGVWCGVGEPGVEQVPLVK